MKLFAVNSSGKKTISREKIAAKNLGGHLNVRITNIINKRKLGESRTLDVYCLLGYWGTILIRQFFFCERCYSPDVYSFRLCSALNPDSSISINGRCSQQWLAYALYRMNHIGVQNAL